MKKINVILFFVLVAIVIVLLFVQTSCSNKLCPTYGDSGNRSSNYSNTKPIK